MPNEIALQYIEDGDQQASAGTEFTDSGILLHEGAHVPRVGEFVQMLLNNSSKTYVVKSVITRIVILGDAAPGSTAYVTLGPVPEESRRLSIINE